MFLLILALIPMVALVAVAAAALISSAFPEYETSDDFFRDND